MASKKIKIVSDYQDELLAQLRIFADLEVVDIEPDFVISYGGDGMLMRAEFLFPNVPKLFLKKSRVGKLAQHDDNDLILKKFVAGDFGLENFLKLEASTRDKKVVALNDVVIHNTNPRHAIRYRVMIDDKSFKREIIGDGVVLATPLGSTGYYRSITDSYFELGIGLAFNNSTEQSDHVVLRPDREVKIEITRGPAECYADNQTGEIKLGEGDGVVVRASSIPAQLVKVRV